MAAAVCGGCALRLAGSTDCAAIVGAADAGAPGVVCPVCLGITSQLGAPFRQRVAGACSRYTDPRGCYVAVTVPRACALRAALQRAQQAQPDQGGQPPDLREVVAWAARGAFQEGLPLGPDREDIRVRVVFEHPGADAAIYQQWGRIPGAPGQGDDERRFAPDGTSYTKPQFRKHFGGLREWNKARVDTQQWPSTKMIEQCLASATAEQLRCAGAPTAVTSPATLATASERRPLFLLGRYLKLDRCLPQSPWVLGGKRVGDSSLQEEVVRPLLPRLFPRGLPEPPAPAAEPAPKRRRTDDAGDSGDDDCGAGDRQDLTVAGVVAAIGGVKLHGAGREDKDVRMLGDGRPFVLEVSDPPRRHFDEPELRAMEAEVNASDAVQVVPGTLQCTDAGITVRMHDASQSKRKEYRCVVWVARNLRSAEGRRLVRELARVSDLAVQQKTPIRVLHRRTATTRAKTIHSAAAEVLNDHWMVLDLVTSAGTYVKEFVNGDRGRTRPSVAEWFNCPADLMQLDVTDVQCDLADLCGTAS
eukprot:TRINITY_DN32847_c0_g1_i1.p1 TRINITY_DN32847_c0_g1~~TRINITY_DN32847_c0_g1_i1.p1  ORF type:complete len:530 (+),score=122.60 TRINITY_DN32847_c0_g1_i1:83-1672(+)